MTIVSPGPGGGEPASPGRQAPSPEPRSRPVAASEKRLDEVRANIRHDPYVKMCPVCSREFGDEHKSCPHDDVPLVSLDTGAGERGQDMLGKVIDGRYRLERIVGRGGMGTVYACRHVVVGKAFAMKVLRSGVERSEEILQRFIREAQATNSIQSRHICEMTDFGQLDNGAFYVVMELLDGVSLTRALRDGRLSADAIRDVFVQISETLQKAHAQGIVHRDLKPDNVILVHDEECPHFAKLVDFGIAKMMQAEASDLTETGVILGTPYYMSPEQARGDPLDHRSDIYSLGVIMYRAYTGRLPFIADTAMGVLTRHLTEQPELPSRLTDVNPVIERVILRCMEKQPIDRFQSMADVAAALQSSTDEVSEIHDRPTVDEANLRAMVQAEQAAAGAEAVVAPAGPAGPPPGPGAAPSGAYTPVSGVHAPAGVPTPTAAGQPPTGSHSPAVLPGAMAEPLPPELQGEAATHRGLVSTHINARPARAAPGRLLGWVVAGVLLLVVGAGGAFVWLGREETPEQAPATTAAPTALESAETTASTTRPAASATAAATTSADAGPATPATPATARPFIHPTATQPTPGMGGDTDHDIPDVFND